MLKVPSLNGIRGTRNLTSACKGVWIKPDSHIIGQPPDQEKERYVHNRNPRNLEKLRLAYQFEGYNLEVPGNTYWHKIVVKITRRHVSAALIHNSDFTVLTASTNEWCLRKQLYSTSDKMACIVLGRVFARRCLEAGISETACFLNRTPGGKVDLLMKEIENGGISLTEPSRLKPYDLKTMQRPEFPWEVLEE